MSRRRRRATRSVNYDEDDDSDDDAERNYTMDIFLQIARNIASISKPSRGRTPAKRKKSSTAPRASRGRCRTSASTSTRSNTMGSRHASVASTDPDPIDTEYYERVRNRVNSHFKSSIVLVSDNEDAAPPPPQAAKPASQSRFSKSFYVLTDSDDDVLPSTSTGPDVQKTTTTESTAPAAPETVPKDELLEVIDDILDCTDASPVKTPVSDSIEDWKAKTEELLSNVDAIMKEVYEKTGTKKKKEEPKKEPEKVENVAPPKTVEVPTCPVCLEVLGGSIQAATTHCGHIFCLSCIKAVAKISRKCPTCRKSVTLKKIVAIYL
ncbi:unnamed protein product [Acanthoscelides obtectus]|uniref:RING-type domain-containing protein n=1 Tax=Acanthoscelides obtectus TaxID=200917 RepID=A0A9P0P1B5_ACAOB|nr:unnamed protein product [Acanthoscelides obtectus]CAK1676759.1 E3 ubiquitin-protein ligase RNF4 [Acanthoscelides obtectus]